MKEIFLMGTGVFLLVTCCTLLATGDSFIFLGMPASTLSVLTGIGAIASFGYFFLGK